MADVALARLGDTPARAATALERLGLDVDPERRILQSNNRYQAPKSAAQVPRGSVIFPYSAEAATVYGEPRYTWASGLPMRPG